MVYEGLCYSGIGWDADGLLFDIRGVMKEKNKNYHTVLDYQKLGDELALRYYSSPEYMRLKDLSKEEIQKEVKQEKTQS